MKNKLLIGGILILAVLAIAFSAYADNFYVDNYYETLSGEASLGAAPVLRVRQGGTGAVTFTAGQCLVGNGTGAITSQACSAGGGGGASAWSTSTNGVLLVYPNNTSDVVVIGGTATTSDVAFEVIGDSEFDTANFSGAVTFPSTINVTGLTTFTNASGTLATIGTTYGNLVGDVTGDLTGSVTGASSLNVLKTGDTLTGKLTMTVASSSAFQAVNYYGTTYNGTTFIGAVTGNVTGNVAGKLTGNASSTLITTDTLYPTNISGFFGSDCVYGTVVRGIDADGTFDCVATSTAGTGYWTQTGSDIYYTTGNVGIGTTTPDEELTISGALPTLRMIDSDAYSYMDLIMSSGSFYFRPNGAVNDMTIGAFEGDEYIYIDIGNNQISIGDGAVNSNGTVVRVDDSEQTIYMNGNVGIGTTTPQYGATLNVLDTTEQLRLSYNGGDYASFTVNDDGDLNIVSSQAATATTTIQSKGLVIDFGAYSKHCHMDGATSTCYIVTD